MSLHINAMDMSTMKARNSIDSKFLKKLTLVGPIQITLSLLGK
jgi:hypothetical protein